MVALPICFLTFFVFSWVFDEFSLFFFFNDFVSRTFFLRYVCKAMEFLWRFTALVVLSRLCLGGDGSCLTYVLSNPLAFLSTQKRPAARSQQFHDLPHIESVVVALIPCRIMSELLKGMVLVPHSLLTLGLGLGAWRRLKVYLFGGFKIIHMVSTILFWWHFSLYV